MADRRSLAVHGEEDFSVFYETWRLPIHRSLALTLGDVGLAEEAVDEAMARALKNWAKLSKYDRPEGWLYRVGLNWARGVSRKRRYELLSELQPDLIGSDDPLPDPELVGAVASLSLKLRAVVIARYYLDLSTLEVAEALDIPAGTVKSRLSRALRKLAHDLGDST